VEEIRYNGAEIKNMDIHANVLGDFYGLGFDYFKMDEFI